MAIFTVEELKKKHGVKSEDFKSVGLAPETPQPQEKQGFTDRVSSAIKTRGENVYNEITNSSQNPLLSGVKATGQAFSAIGDVANEAIQSVPGVRDVANTVTDTAKKGFNSLTDSISNTKLFQEASQYPEQTKVLEDFLQAGGSLGDIANNIILSKGVADTGNTAVNVSKTVGQKVSQGATTVKDKLTPTPEQIASERTVKMTQGLAEQNTRLKSADKSFNKNTIVRKTKDGGKVTITPTDTFVKNGIAPVIEKGSIQMGDYQTGVGELGKIKTKVSDIDAKIDTKLVNSGQKINLEKLKQKAIKNAESNDDFRQSGTVSQNVAKIENRFADYKTSYGETLDIAELNNIRKVANKDYSPDTQDISRIVGDTAREYVYKTTPDGSVRALLQRQGELLAAKKYAETINGTKVTGGRLGNIALRTGGAVVGSTVSGLPVVGPVLGMIGGEFAARALQQSQFKSAWTELRAQLLSNKTVPSQSAKTIPKSATISNKLTNNPQGGYIRVPGVKGPPNNQSVSLQPKVPRFSAEVKSNLVDIIDDYRLNGGKDLTLQQDAARIAEDFNIPPYKKYGDLVNKLQQLLDAQDKYNVTKK